jgi:hypothetical protein
MKYSYVKSFYQKTRRYHYVTRPGFPVVRIRAEPRTLEFDTVYDLVMRAETVDEVKKIRRQVGMRANPNIVPRYTETNAWIKRLEEKYGVR